ncbi:sulfotransferase family protein [Marixanthomonas ophiurae]|uniref:Sulfotransferase n=1 Tax=Marixanthomonas ophiurae TaxID=387659 RepID=A0A3E1QD55_9FLAO|nr:sulfotransferase [Marixanthomonas ophiurae]RFN60052.1 sulfotransferase [Marixanthomonas ophiurae]
MSGTTDTNWISKQPEKLPDFIIGGAMKSGTTTLHTILDRHPSINLAHNELGFFDIDNIINHPDFNFFNNKTKEWTVQSMQEHPERLWNWYYSNFDSIKKEGSIVGEDSTTYLAAPKAAERIVLQQKPIKMIFILRHPTKRAISNYLHLLKSGRAVYNLEDTLRYDPNSIINRSRYKQQLGAYYKHLPFERIKIILFEDLTVNTKTCIADICEFLNVDFSDFKENDWQAHSNKTKTPKRLRLQLMRNRLLRNYGNRRYASFLPLQAEFQKKNPFGQKVFNKIHKRLNPLQTEVKFKPNPSTVNYLDNFFKIELEGLDELVQKDVLSKWFNQNK